MGQELRITQKKFYPSIKNGDDFNNDLATFDTNLAGLIAEYSKAEFLIEIGWSSEVGIGDEWIVTSRTASQYEISRRVGSFADDGWSVGNKFDFLVDDTLSSPPSTSILPATATIDFISDDGSFMFVTSATDLTFESPYSGHRLRANASYPENHLDSLVYSPNLIENSEQYTNVTLQNGSRAEWQAENIRSGLPVPLAPLGTNKSFVSGIAQVTYEGDVNTYYQTFKIEHTYVIHPYFTVEDGFDVPDFADGTSLKYVFRSVFRKSPTDVASSKTFTYQNARGLIGWLGQTVSKAPSALSFSYSGRLSATDPVTATIQLNGGTFSPSWRYQLIFSKVPTEAEYSAPGTFYENFGYFYETQDAGQSATFASKITQMSSSYTGTTLELTAEFDAFTQYSINDEYTLFLLIGDMNDYRNRSILFLDRDTFDADTSNSGLISLSQEYKNYNLDVGAREVHIEDGLSVQFSFDLDLNKFAFLKSLSAKLVAHNAAEGKYFALDSYTFNLPSVVSNDVQILDFTEARGYPLPASEFNIAQIVTTEQENGIQSYIGTLGQKISWQDWIANPAVSDVFFDSTKPNNNKNLKTSNYSLKEGYQIKMLFEATANGIDPYNIIRDQKYEFFGPILTVYDYNEDGEQTPQIVATIETFDESGNSLDGNILAEGDTLFRCIWDAEDDIETLLGVSATHRIEVFEQGGYQIYELSSNKNDSIASSPLFSSNNRVSLRLEGGNIISECLVKGSKLVAETYSLSAKITKI